MRARGVGALLIVALLNTSCTLGGATAGLLIATSEPQYNEQALPSPSSPPLALSPGTPLRIVLRTGASTKCESVRFQPAGPSEVDSHLVVCLPRKQHPLESIALSDVQSIGVEDHDSSYVGFGALLGLIVDVLVIGVVTSWLRNLSS
jgi:hypothetical protein